MYKCKTALGTRHLALTARGACAGWYKAKSTTGRGVIAPGTINNFAALCVMNFEKTKYLPADISAHVVASAVCTQGPGATEPGSPQNPNEVVPSPPPPPGAFVQPTGATPRPAPSPHEIDPSQGMRLLTCSSTPGTAMFVSKLQKGNSTTSKCWPLLVLACLNRLFSALPVWGG